VSARFYRHEIGLTADQRRADRQIRLGLTGVYVALTCVIFVLLLESALVSSLVPSDAVNPAVGALIAMACMGLLWAWLVALLRLRLERHHPAHTHLRAWSALLLPATLLIGWLATDHLGQSHEALRWPAVVALALLALLAGAMLDRLRLDGHQSRSRVLVIDLQQRSRTWHTHSELAALDEAAEAASAGMIPEQPRAGEGDWRL